MSRILYESNKKEKKRNRKEFQFFKLANANRTDKFFVYKHLSFHTFSTWSEKLVNEIHDIENRNTHLFIIKKEKNK